MRDVKSRWAIVALALLSASAFAVAVQAGRWWSVGDVQIGPFGSRNCFGGDCRPTGLSWVGGSERWARFGVATWAAGLLAMLVLLVIAGAVAARRSPKLVAKMTLVTIATALAAAIGFIAQFPGVEGAAIDRGVWLFVVAVPVGIAAAVLVLRQRPAPDLA